MIGSTLHSLTRINEMKMLNRFRAPGAPFESSSLSFDLALQRVEVDGVWYRVGVEGIDSHEDPEVIWP